MTLDPQAKALLEQMAQADSPPLNTLSPEDARKVYRAMRGTGEEIEPVAHVEDRTIPGPESEIPIRIYTPENNDNDKLPILVYYHGGGWVIGDLDSHDPVCRTLTNHADCIVVSVDYRLAPEHKFPTAVEDSFAALEWVFENAESIGGDSQQIAVGGDSAGGNLATVVAIMAKEKQSPPIVFQLLIYPSTGVGATKSYEENGEGLYLTKDLMTWFRQHYFRDANDQKNPYASPYRYEDVSGLPPALVITAEYDPLRDDGKAYADKLEEAGVQVEYVDYAGMIHGFVSMAAMLDKGKQALYDAADALKNAFLQAMK